MTSVHGLGNTHLEHNQLVFNKWKRASQPEEIFHRFPEFAYFLEKSKLLSQIKVTRDSVQILEGEPAMLVEGVWTKWSDLKARFKTEDSSFYGTKFVVDSTGEVFTYLDNRRGLQKYHPYQTIGEIPISVLDEDEINAVRSLANRFIRPEEACLSQNDRDLLNAERPFVLQIVTSHTDRGNSNLSQTLRNPRHAYLRFIAGTDLPNHSMKKGDVFEFGFGWKWGASCPLKMKQGLLCSLDPWEYISCDKRYVTCIPLNAEKAAAAFEFALQEQRKHIRLGREIGFQLTQKNCTVYDRKIAEHAGVAIPTEIRLAPLLYRILPDFLKKLGALFLAIEKICSIFADLFSSYNLPWVLQEWQKEQASTFVIENPIRLTIVPG